MDNLSVSAISFAKQIYNQINDPNNGTVINNALFTNIVGSNKVIAGHRWIWSVIDGFTYRLENGGTQYQPDLFCYMNDTGLCSLVLGSSSNVSSTSFIYPSLGFTTKNSANQNILTARIHITMNHSAGSEAGSLRFSTKASSGSLTERFAIGSTGESHFLFTNGNSMAKFMPNTTANTSTFELYTLYNGTSVKNISLINKAYASSSPTSAIFKLQKTDFSFTARIGQGSEEKEVIVFNSDVTRDPKIFTVNTDTDDGIFVVSAQHPLSFGISGSWMSIEPDLLSIGVTRTNAIFIGDGDLSTFIIHMGASNTLEIKNNVNISNNLVMGGKLLCTTKGINIGSGNIRSITVRYSPYELTQIWRDGVSSGGYYYQLLGLFGIKNGRMSFLYPDPEDGSVAIGPEYWIIKRQLPPNVSYNNLLYGIMQAKGTINYIYEYTSLFSFRHTRTNPMTETPPHAVGFIFGVSPGPTVFNDSSFLSYHEYFDFTIFYVDPN